MPGLAHPGDSLEQLRDRRAVEVEQGLHQFTCPVTGRPDREVARGLESGLEVRNPASDFGFWDMVSWRVLFTRDGVLFPP